MTVDTAGGGRKNLAAFFRLRAFFDYFQAAFCERNKK